MRLGTAVIVASMLLAACGEPVLDPGGAAAGRVAVGVIDVGAGTDSALIGPTEGVVGEPLSYRVTTFGYSCFSSAGAQVINQGLQMTIIPYDSISAGPCQSLLQAITRDVTVVFDRAGAATLRLQGQSWAGRSPAVLARPIEIRQ